MTVLREPKRITGNGLAHDLSHVRGYGWRPQLPDARDKLYMARLRDLPPAEFDLRPSTPTASAQRRCGPTTSGCSP